jgi:hypothetical protein
MKNNRLVQYTEFDLNQYEEKCDKGKFLPYANLNAIYLEQKVNDYKGNELIEALPPSYTMEELFNILENKAFFDREIEKEFDNITRLHSVLRVKELLFLNIEHFLVARKIDIMLKQSYSTKRIPTPKTLSKRFMIAEQLPGMINAKTGKIKQVIELKTKKSLLGFSIFGVSGGGKSVAVDNIMLMYPQAIVHTEYQGKNLKFTQLVYIKIDTPHNGSTKGVCQEFFKEVDKVLGTEYEEKHKRETATKMISTMAKIASIHSLGCLIIDEIQYLANTKRGLRETFSFIVSLQNKIGIPILFIGTYKAVKEVLTINHSGTRRATGIGEVEWGRMKNDESFKIFLEKLWKYQWVKNKAELSESMIDKFYEYSVGITDRIVKLFMLCQIQAIESGEEIISRELLEDVTKSMPLSHKLMKAINEDDYEELSRYDDVIFEEHKKIVENKIDEISKKMANEELRNSARIKEIEKQKTLDAQLIGFLVSMGANKNIARNIVEEYLMKNHRENNIKKIKRTLAGVFISGEYSTQKKKKEVPAIEDANIDIKNDIL